MQIQLSPHGDTTLPVCLAAGVERGVLAVLLVGEETVAGMMEEAVPVEQLAALVVTRPPHAHHSPCSRSQVRTRESQSRGHHHHTLHLL